jgi:hypothetical protein
MFVLHKPFQPSLMLVGKAGAYLIVEQLKCTFKWVGSWPFLQTLDKDGKALPRTNTLAYNGNS